MYPLGMLWDESNLVIERVNGAIVTEANLLKFAVHGILSKDARRHFDKMTKTLNVEAKPHDDERPPDRLMPEGYEKE